MYEEIRGLKTGKTLKAGHNGVTSDLDCDRRLSCIVQYKDYKSGRSVITERLCTDIKQDFSKKSFQYGMRSKILSSDFFCGHNKTNHLAYY